MPAVCFVTFRRRLRRVLSRPVVGPAVFPAGRLALLFVSLPVGWLFRFLSGAPSDALFLRSAGVRGGCRRQRRTGACPVAWPGPGRSAMRLSGPAGPDSPRFFRFSELEFWNKVCRVLVFSSKKGNFEA